MKKPKHTHPRVNVKLDDSNQQQNLRDINEPNQGSAERIGLCMTPGHSKKWGGGRTQKEKKQNRKCEIFEGKKNLTWENLTTRKKDRRDHGAKIVVTENVAHAMPYIQIRWEGEKEKKTWSEREKQPEYWWRRWRLQHENGIIPQLPKVFKNITLEFPTR